MAAIVSASYKTDIPAFYGDWFLNRLEAGFARVVNPYSGKPFEVSLAPDDVAGFVFWTRNAGPFLDGLERVRAKGFPFIVQYTVTGYARALDASAIPVEAAAGHLARIRDRFGAGVGVWRYDPVMVAGKANPDWHRENFAGLCARLRGLVDEAVLSFAQIYRKSRRNLDAAGLDWRDPPMDEKRAILADLAAIAHDHGIRPTLCGQPHLLSSGLEESACIDANRLSEIAARGLDVPRKPHRTDCRCWASRDIGDYDTCPHGCVYCYAVRSRGAARANHRRHDPEAEFLIPDNMR